MRKEGDALFCHSQSVRPWTSAGKTMSSSGWKNKVSRRWEICTKKTTDHTWKRVKLSWQAAEPRHREERWWWELLADGNQLRLQPGGGNTMLHTLLSCFLLSLLSVHKKTCFPPTKFLLVSQNTFWWKSMQSCVFVKHTLFVAKDTHEPHCMIQEK